MVSSVCSFTHAFNKSNDALKNNSEFLSNRSMKEDAENLLISGVISYSDYLEFIEGEKLNEYIKIEKS